MAQLDGWWQQATGTAESLHGRMAGIEAEVDQLLRFQADPDSFDTKDRLVVEGLADAQNDIRNTAGNIQNSVLELHEAAARLGELANLELPH